MDVRPAPLVSPNCHLKLDAYQPPSGAYAAASKLPPQESELEAVVTFCETALGLAAGTLD